MPRRTRRRPWGSITSVTRTKHVLRWTQDTPQGRRRLSKTVYGTFAEADRELSRIRSSIADESPSMTIGQVYERWYSPWLHRRLESGKVKEGTVWRYGIAWEKTCAPKWRDVPASAVAPADVQSWLLSLTAGNAKAAMAVLRKVADFAVQYEVAQGNKFRIPYEMPTEKKRIVPDVCLTLEQADALLDKIRGSAIEPAYILACFGSARVGESLGVKAVEVEPYLLGGSTFAIVPIVRRMPQVGCEPMADGDLKTKDSERSLVIPPPYSTRLLEIADERKSDGYTWLSTEPDGLPIKQNRLKYLWRGCVPFSKLRVSWRTFAQYEWGIDYDTCEVLMGHALQGVTGRHYLKPTVDQLVEKVADCMGLR